MSMLDATRMTTVPHSRSYSVYLNAASLWGVVIATIALGILLTRSTQILALDFKTQCEVLGAISVLTVAVTIVLTRGNIWAPSSVYLAMLALFHFGLALLYGFGSVSTTMQNVTDRWFFSAYAPEALFVTAVGVSSCALGISVAGLARRRENTIEVENTSVRNKPDFDHYLSLIGCCMVAIAVIMWFALVVLNGGFGLLLGSYGTYLTATAGAPMGYIWLLLGSGLAFLAATSTNRPTPAHMVGYALFATFALFALPLGLRGEVLFASLGALVVRARRGRRPPWGATLVGVFVVLVLISAIREVRQVGVSEAGTIEVNASVLDSVAELGSTLRPVVETIKWNPGGSNQQNGATYWAPIDRFFCKISPARICPVARDDTRLLNVVVSERVGPIGFSPIAEAYENFRITGVVGVMLVFGILVGTLNGWPSTTMRNAVVGVILVELLINVRNAFTALPSHLVFGFLCILAAWILATLFPSASRISPNTNSDDPGSFESVLR